MQFIKCEFYGVEIYFGLDSNSMLYESILIYLPRAIVANIFDPGLLFIVRKTKFDAATFIVAFEGLRDMDWSSMELALFVGWLFLQQVDGTVMFDVNCFK